MDFTVGQAIGTAEWDAVPELLNRDSGQLRGQRRI